MVDESHDPSSEPAVTDPSDEDTPRQSSSGPPSASEEDVAPDTVPSLRNAIRANDFTRGVDVGRLVAQSGVSKQFAELQANVNRMFAQSDAFKQLSATQSSIGKLIAQSDAFKEMSGLHTTLARIGAAQASAFSEKSGLHTTIAKMVGAQSEALAGLSRSSTLRAFAGARTNLLSENFHVAIRTMLESQTSGLRESIRGIARSVRLIFPSNLRDIEGLSFEAIQRVVMEDGIPLYGIPRKRTAAALLNAATSQERRDIVGRRWRTITDDCEAYLQRRLSAELDAERRYALEAVEALRAGHLASAQALATNLLDTLVTRHFAQDRIILRPSRRVKTPDGYADFVLRKYWALAPIWSAYQHFHPDSVPRRFGRHPSAHAVVSVQYTRRNAVHALMLVSSLIGYLDEVKSGTRP